MTAVYPDINEILPPTITRRLNASIIEDIKTRYAELGPKYVTEEMHTDGRRINGCMSKDSAQDAIEEVVDAIFNVCIMHLKGRTYLANIILRKLVEVYEELDAVREK